MGIRSQNNPAASYLDKWLATGAGYAGGSGLVMIAYPA